MTVAGIEDLKHFLTLQPLASWAWDCFSTSNMCNPTPTIPIVVLKRVLDPLKYTFPQFLPIYFVWSGGKSYHFLKSNIHTSLIKASIEENYGENVMLRSQKCCEDLGVRNMLVRNYRQSTSFPANQIYGKWYQPGLPQPFSWIPRRRSLSINHKPI